MPHRRSFSSVLLASDLIKFHPQAGSLPPDVRAVIDPQDPAVDWIIDAIVALRDVGMDMTEPSMLARAVEAGQRRADEFAESVRSGKFSGDQERRQKQIEWTRCYYARRAARLVVYYARVGNRCKIGWTSNLKQRMTNLQPEELLATEPGGVVTETERHEQFKALRVVGEWFRYEGSLVEHVESLRG